MLITNWLNSVRSRIQRCPRYNSRARRAMRKRWEAVQQNQLTTAEVLEERQMLTGFDPEGTPFASLPSESMIVTDGDYIVVGIPKQASFLLATENDPYVYKRNDNGTPSDLLDDTWDFQAELLIPNRPISDAISSVDISGDTIVVGFQRDDVNGNSSGAVYVFTRSGENWTQEAILTPDVLDADEYDLFGAGVSISGDTIFVGAPGDDEYGEDLGSVYVFNRTGTTWTETQKLASSNSLYVPDHYLDVFHRQFGGNLKIDGDTLAVTNSIDGTISVFTQQGGIWGGEIVLTPTYGLQNGENFIDIDGDRIIVSTLDEVSIFTRSGNDSYIQEKLELPVDIYTDNGDLEWSFSVDAVAIHGDKIVVKSSEGFYQPPHVDLDPYDSFVRIFELTEGKWTFSQIMSVDVFSEPDSYNPIYHGIEIDENKLIADGKIFRPKNIGISISDAVVTEGDSGIKNLTFTITRRGEEVGDLNEAISVAYKTIAGGTALAGLDYPEIDSTTISFAADATALVQVQEISIPIYGDHETEFNETVFVQLSPVTVGPYISDSIGIGTIQNEDVGISVGDVIITEGDSGTTKTITFNVTRGGDLSQAATVDYLISAGSAVEGIDYIVNGSSTGTISFAADSQSNFQYEAITIDIIGDDRVELDEMITITLQNSSLTPITKSSATATIINDDSATITIDDVVVSEAAGTATFTITLDQEVELDGNLTIDYLVGDPQLDPSVTNTPLPASFFTDANNSPIQTGQLSFTGIANEKQYVVVQNIDDNFLNKVNKVFQVKLSNLQAEGRDVELSGASHEADTIYGLGEIENDDIASFTISNDVTVYEGGVASFTVTLDRAVDLDPGKFITLEYSSGVGQSGTLTFSGLENEQKTINIATVNDNVIEPDKVYSVSIHNLEVQTGLLVTQELEVVIADERSYITVLNNDAGFSAPLIGEIITEGEGGANTPITFTVTRAGVFAGDLNSVATIDYKTWGNWPLDHETIDPPATLTFPADPTARFQTLTFTIDAFDDNIVELDHNVVVEFENPSANLPIVGPFQSFAFLKDNDSATLSVSDVIVNENGTATITVTQDQTEVEDSYQVRFETIDGTAQAGSDYTAKNEVAIFSGAAGESHSFTVSLTNDSLDEYYEDFFVNLSLLQLNGRNISLDTSQAKVTIRDDDAPSVSISDARVDEENLTISFDVTVDKALGSSFTVDYATSDNSAKKGSDYDEKIGTLSFTGLQPNETKTITIDLIDDTIVELEEYFTINLSNIVTGGGIVNLSDSEGIGTIDNTDSGFSIDDWSVTESDNGTTQTLTFTVLRDGDLSQAASIDYVISGTATAGTDFTGIVTATLNFAADVNATYQQQTISIDVLGDNLVEADETVLVTLQNATTGTIQKAVGIGTILNDETATLSIDDVTVSEEAGTAQFNVTLDRDVQGDVTVDFETFDSTAFSSSSDYQYQTGSVTFTGGSAGTQIISILINDDNIVEGDEEFLVRLLDGTINAGGGDVIFVDQEGVGKITNTDSATVSIAGVTQVEGSPNTFDFLVTLSNAVDTDVSFKAITDNGDTVPGNTILGSAIAGQDYTSINQDITLLAGGALTTTVSIQILDENLVELDEIFYVQLQNLLAVDGRDVTFAGGALTERATGTITNDDIAEISVSYDSNLLIIEQNLGQSGFHKFDLAMSKAVDTSVTVDVSSMIGLTATEGIDYEWFLPTVTFSAGQTAVTAYVRVLGDDILEGDHDGYLKGAYETFGIELSNIEAQNRNVLFSNTSVETKIYDDDHIDDTKFNIEIDFHASLANETAAQNAANAAVARWESIIVGDLGQNFPAVGGPVVAIPEIIFFDDILITVTQENLDGNGNTLAQARPVYIRPGSKLPFFGEITIDSSDLNNPGLTDILTHEIAHALGFGAIWEQLGLININGSNPLFTGQNATNEYEALLTQAGLPSENYIGVPVANDGGAGTYGSHWRESVFGAELLTGFYDSGIANPISRVSIASFADMGYQVNYSQADPYSLSASSQSGGESFGHVEDGFSAISSSLILSEGVIGISVDDISAQEDGVYEFTVSLSAPADEEITVRANTVLGTAGADDFTSMADQLITFAAGETTKTILVTVNDDSIVEKDETFSIVLSDAKYNGATDPDRVTIFDDTGIATITNNDSATLSINDVTVNESAGTATFTVTLDNDVDAPLTVDFYSADSTATTAGNDYVFESGVLHFAGTAGETVTFTVQINEDTIHEYDESFVVDLSNVRAEGRNVTLADSQGVATIIDNDSPRFSIGDAVVDEDAGTATFTVTLDKATSNPLTIDFATADNTAVAANDYIATSGTLNFAGTADETQTITVSINNDRVAELEESFFVNLSNVQSMGEIIIISDGTGKGTILGNDTGTAGDDDFLIRMNADGVTLELLNNLTLVDSRLLSDLTSITIDGGAGDDTLTLDLSNGLPFPVGAINFKGGTNTISGDSLNITQGSYVGTFGNITHTFTSNGDGSINIDGQIINYSGLEPITDDLVAADRVFDFTGAAETITLSENNTANDGLSSIDSTLSESVEFTNATSSLTILTGNGSGSDVVNVEGLDGLSVASLTITGDADDDVNFQTNSTSMGANDLTVNAQTITVSSGISSTSGAVSLTASRNIVLNAASTLTTIDGGINLVANSGGTTTGTFIGIDANNATIQSTGNGNVSLTSISGSGDGIYLHGGTSVTSTATGVSAGTISLNGTGGDKANYQHGILLIDASISSVDGAISLTGQAGGDGTGNDHVGLYLHDSSISSTGTGLNAATITLNGTAGNGISTNRGIRTALFSVSSMDGDISIIGQGAGDASGNSNEGIVLATTTIASTGNAAISIHGSAGAGLSYNQGVYVTSTDISSVNADVTMISDGHLWFDTTSDMTATSGNLQVTANYLSANNTGNLTLEGNAVLSTGTGNIDLDAAGDISLTSLVTTGTVTVDSTSGSILDNDDTNIDIVAATATLNAAGSIGTAGNPLTTQMDAHTAVSGTSDVNINNRELFSISDISANEDGTFTFTVSINQATDQNVTVLASTAYGTADASDFTAISNQLVTIAAGQTSATVTVSVINDNVLENDETFTVVLSDPKYNGATNAARIVIGDGTATGTILNEDSVKIIDDGDSGFSTTGPGWTYTTNIMHYGDDIYYLSAGANPGASASWVFDDLAPGIYRVSGHWSTHVNWASDTELTVSGIEGGPVTQTVNQETLTADLNDSGVDWQDLGFFIVDANGTITVTMANEVAEGFVVADAMRIEKVAASLSINDVSISEDAGTATFTVTLSEVVLGGVSVDWSTANGTATAGADYTAGSGTLNFTGTAGETQTITITLNDDFIAESDETFLVNLSNVVASETVGLVDPSGTGTITDDDRVTIDGTAAADDFQLQMNADGLTLEVLNNSTLVYSGLLAEIAEFNINSGAGADTLTVDLSNGLPFPIGNINFDGETDGGTLVLDTASYAGSLTTVTHTLNSDTSGSISIDGQIINYTNITSLTDDLATTNRIFDFTGAAETVTLSDHGTSNDGYSSIDSTLGAAVTFANTSSAVTVLSNAGSGADTINVQGLDSLNASSLIITGDADDDVNFQTNSTVMGANDLTVNAQTITVSSGISSTSGAVSLTASRNIALNTTSSLTTFDGGITLVANTGGTTTGDFVGIDANNATIQSTGSGDISLTGVGGSSDSNYGIHLNSSNLLSTSTNVNAGTITLNGTGGTGTASNLGIFLNTNSIISSVYGNIQLTGQATDGTGAGNVGVMVFNGSEINSTGTGVNAATISINGTGGVSNFLGHGVMFKSSGVPESAKVTSIDGNILITGQATNGAGATHYGVELTDAVVSSSGTGANAATITINGTGGGGNNDNHGVLLVNTLITSVEGATSLAGQAGGNGTGTNNVGVYMDYGSISSTGTGIDAATITINGTGGAGTVSNRGIFVYQADITSVDGDILLTAVGGGGNSADENQNHGVNLHEANVTSTGTGVNAAKITIDGTGGTGQNSNVSTYLYYSDITSAAGNIAISGSGATTTGDSNHGVILHGGTVSSTATGINAANITIDGIGGTGATANYGVYLTSDADFTTVDGDISLTGIGTGNGTGIANIGVNIDGTISSTGTGANAGKITIDGTGGAGTQLHRGITVNNSISSINGDISLTGQGGGDSAGLHNQGILLNQGAISSTGTGPDAAVISIHGTGGPGTASNDGFVGTTQSTISSVVTDISIISDGNVWFYDNTTVESTSGDINIDTNYLNPNNTGVFVMNTGTLFNSGSGNIDLDANGDIYLTSLVSLGHVAVDSASGAIYDHGDLRPEIVATSANINALYWVGQSSNPLETNVANLSGTGINGGFNVNNTIYKHIIDDGDVGFNISGSDWVHFVWNQYYQNDAYYILGGGSAANGSNTASWAFSNLNAGRYRLTTTWNPGVDRADNVPYSVSGIVGGTVNNTFDMNTLTPNVTDDGANWESLGYFDVAQDGTLTVTISDNLVNGTIYAQAMRLDQVHSTLSVSDVSVNEGAGIATFTVTSSMATGAAFTVDYATANGTAIAGSDYTSTSGTLNFAGNVAGETQTITVNLSSDNIVELDENFFVNLSNVQSPGLLNIILEDSQVSGTITNDDTTVISLANANVSQLEGDSGTALLSAVINITNPLDFDLHLWSPIIDNTATVADGDFVDPQLGAWATISAGATSTTIQFSLNGDTKIEADEDFTFAFVSNFYSAISPLTVISEDYSNNISFTGGVETLFGTGTIINDDFVKIIDNGDAGFSQTGSWFTYGGNPTFYQNDYSYVNGGGNGSNTSSWAFTDLPAGTYRLSGTWYAHAIRATNIPVTISGIVGGNVATTINQEVLVQDVFDDGVYWQDLGSYEVDGNGTITVTISDDQTNGNVLAEAYRIELINPLMAAEGQSSSNAPAITQADLNSVRDAALNYWASTGLTETQIDLLESVNFALYDLPDAMLGGATSTSILIDLNAAGYGWFVDTTPFESNEFTLDSNGELIANEGSIASGRMDLLTVVMHELGHTLGHHHEDEDELMGETLDLSERHLPEVDDFFMSIVEGDNPLLN